MASRLLSRSRSNLFDPAADDDEVPAAESRQERRRSKGGLLNAFKNIASGANPRKSPQQEKSFEVIRVSRPRRPAGGGGAAQSSSSAATTPAHTPEIAPSSSVSARPAPVDDIADDADEASYFAPLRLVTSNSLASTRSQHFSAADEYHSGGDTSALDVTPDQEHPQQRHQPSSRQNASPNPPPSSQSNRHRNSFAALTRRLSGLSAFEGGPSGALASTTDATPAATSFTLRSMRNVTEASSSSTDFAQLPSTSLDDPQPVTAPQSPAVTPSVDIPSHTAQSPTIPTTATTSPTIAQKPSLYTQPSHHQGSSISVAKFRNARTRSESGNFSVGAGAGPAAADYFGSTTAASRAASPGPCNALPLPIGLQTPDGLRPSEQLAALEAELAIGGRVTPMLRQLEDRYENSLLRSHANKDDFRDHRRRASLDPPASASANAPPAVPDKDSWMGAANYGKQKRQASLDASLLLRSGAASPLNASPMTSPHIKPRRFSDKLDAGGLGSALGLTNAGPSSHVPSAAASPSQPASPSLSSLRGSGRGWDSATILSSLKGSSHQAGRPAPRTLLDALTQMEEDEQREKQRQEQQEKSDDMAQQGGHATKDSLGFKTSTTLLAPFPNTHKSSSQHLTTDGHSPHESPSAQERQHLSVLDTPAHNSSASTSQAADVLLALAATPEPTTVIGRSDSYFPDVAATTHVTTHGRQDVQHTLVDSPIEAQTAAVMASGNLLTSPLEPEETSPRAEDSAGFWRFPGQQAKDNSAVTNGDALPTARRPSADSSSAPIKHRYGIDPDTLEQWQKHADAVFGPGQAPVPATNKHRKAHSVSHTAARSRGKRSGSTNAGVPVPESPRPRERRETERGQLPQGGLLLPPPSPRAPTQLVRASTTSSAAQKAVRHAQDPPAWATKSSAVQEAPAAAVSRSTANVVPEPTYALPPQPQPVVTDSVLSIELPLGILPQHFAALPPEIKAKVREHHARAVQLAKRACLQTFEAQMQSLWSQVPEHALTGERRTRAPPPVLPHPERITPDPPLAVPAERSMPERRSPAPQGAGLIHPQPSHVPSHQHQQPLQGSSSHHAQPPRGSPQPDATRYIAGRMQQQPQHQHDPRAGASGNWQQHQQPPQANNQYRPPPQRQFSSTSATQYYAQQQQHHQHQEWPGLSQTQVAHHYYPQQQQPAQAVPRGYNHAQIEQYHAMPAQQQPPYWHAAERVYDGRPVARDAYLVPMARTQSQGVTGGAGYPSSSSSSSSLASRGPYQHHNQAASSASLHSLNHLHYHSHHPHPPPPPLPSNQTPPPQRHPSMPKLRIPPADEMSRRPTANFMATPVVDTSAVPLPAIDAGAGGEGSGAHQGGSGGESERVLLTDELKRRNQSRGVTPGEYSSTKRNID